MRLNGNTQCSSIILQMELIQHNQWYIKLLYIHHDRKTKKMRKPYTKGGGQHTICARIDLDKWAWLKEMPNRNRVINQGLWWWYEKFQRGRGLFDTTEDLMQHWDDTINNDHART